jgi:uncharacterized damage-inducible protein DinB
MMSEAGRIWDLLQRSYEGDSWHGPALRELLESVSAAQAASRPVAKAHSIWEIALHIGAYEDVVRRRIGGEPVGELSEPEAWPKVGETTPAAWRETLARFDEGHRRLREALASFPDARLLETVPGRDYPFYIMLYGIIQHDLYHAGQIALLMRAQGVSPQDE